MQIVAKMKSIRHAVKLAKHRVLTKPSRRAGMDPDAAPRHASSEEDSSADEKELLEARPPPGTCFFRVCERGIITSNTARNAQNHLCPGLRDHQRGLARRRTTLI